MRRTTPILTGAQAAALLECDGFKGIDWPALICDPHGGNPRLRTVTTRLKLDPRTVNDVLIAHPLLVLRHLCHQLAELAIEGDRVLPEERIELAVEFALRTGLVTLAQLQGVCGRGVRDEHIFRRIVAERGNEPTTESYAETRLAQLLRCAQIPAWRQVQVYDEGRVVARADFVIPVLDGMQRPTILRPGDGVIVELDSREFHTERFDEDRAKMATYTRLGYVSLAVTPKQVEQQREFVRRNIEGARAALIRATGRTAA